MQTDLSHIQFNVQATHIAFYRDLLGFLGWRILHDDGGALGMMGKGETSLWFIGQVKEFHNDYDGPGMNHLGIGTESPADVDAVAAFLTERGVRHLFETPRHRPEMVWQEDNTYYQVMFESPDGILWEVMYHGPKDV